MPTYLWCCRGCGGELEVFTTIAERNETPDPCNRCEITDWFKPVVAPNVTRASYIDGVKRKGFDEMKKASKLEKEMMNKPAGERSEYRKEIKKLKSID